MIYQIIFNYIVKAILHKGVRFTKVIGKSNGVGTSWYRTLNIDALKNIWDMDFDFFQKHNLADEEIHWFYKKQVNPAFMYLKYMKLPIRIISAEFAEDVYHMIMGAEQALAGGAWGNQAMARAEMVKVAKKYKLDQKYMRLF